MKALDGGVAPNILSLGVEWKKVCKFWEVKTATKSHRNLFGEGFGNFHVKNREGDAGFTLRWSIEITDRLWVRELGGNNLLLCDWQWYVTFGIIYSMDSVQRPVLKKKKALLSGDRTGFRSHIDLPFVSNWVGVSLVSSLKTGWHPVPQTVGLSTWDEWFQLDGTNSHFVSRAEVFK